MAKKSTQAVVKLREIEGKPVVNSDESLTLAIRTSDIRHAVATASDACAAAIACVRQFNALSARVYSARTFVEYEDRWVRYANTAKLRQEIIAIDGGGKFHPGLYTLSKCTSLGRAATGKGHGSVPKPKKAIQPKRKPPVYIHSARGRIHFGDAAKPLTYVHAEYIERK